MCHGQWCKADREILPNPESAIIQTETKGRARLEKLTDITTVHVKAREGANIEDACTDNLWSMQEVQKKFKRQRCLL